MNLLIPMASHSAFFSEQQYPYPKPLIEILGRPMIEHVLENLADGIFFNKVIFVLLQSDCDKFHLDDTVRLLSPSITEVIHVRAPTQGALCSALLAVDHLQSTESLMIANTDQFFDGGIADQVQEFEQSDLDAACLTFSSVHPRWSYVRTNSVDQVIEVAEKRPISRHAIAGVYLYRNSIDFMSHAMDTIRHGASINNAFFIAPVFNEYILAGKNVGHYEIAQENFHTWYSPQKIKDYENLRGWSPN